MKGVLIVLAALVLAPAAHAGGPSLQVGAAEDSPKQATLVAAKAKMTMAQLAGLKAIRLTSLASEMQLFRRLSGVQATSRVRENPGPPAAT